MTCLPARLQRHRRLCCKGPGRCVTLPLIVDFWHKARHVQHVSAYSEATWVEEPIQREIKHVAMLLNFLVSSSYHFSSKQTFTCSHDSIPATSCCCCCCCCCCGCCEFTTCRTGAFSDSCEDPLRLPDAGKLLSGAKCPACQPCKLGCWYMFSSRRLLARVLHY